MGTWVGWYAGGGLAIQDSVPRRPKQQSSGQRRGRESTTKLPTGKQAEEEEGGKKKSPASGRSAQTTDSKMNLPRTPNTSHPPTHDTTTHTTQTRTQTTHHHTHRPHAPTARLAPRESESPSLTASSPTQWQRARTGRQTRDRCACVSGTELLHWAMAGRRGFGAAGARWGCGGRVAALVGGWRAWIGICICICIWAAGSRSSGGAVVVVETWTCTWPCTTSM
jgi:hypothetical protein